jgi:aerobic carbon-monoxide dehydrogenase medium subunit
VIPTTFDYHRASSIDDALKALAAAGGNAKIVAGGHSLVPMMKLRLSEPGMLIDVARIAELNGIREAGGKIEIGAATVHHAIATSPLLRERCPVMADAAATIGDQQVRNRGTIGGSMAHADPSADMPAVMVALQADIQLRSAKGPRTVTATDFFQDLFTVDLQREEIITGVSFTPAKAAAYVKLYQKASHYAIVGVAAVVEAKGGTISSARIGITGAGTHAQRLSKLEQALAGATKQSLDTATANAGAELSSVNADIHASEEYRRAMVGVFAKRAILAALARA